MYFHILYKETIKKIFPIFEWCVTPDQSLTNKIVVYSVFKW